MKYDAPGSNKVLKSYFECESQSQGHKVIVCHLKGRNWQSMHAKYEVSISNYSKVIVNDKSWQQKNRQIGK